MDDALGVELPCAMRIGSLLVTVVIVAGCGASTPPPESPHLQPSAAQAEPVEATASAEIPPTTEPDAPPDAGPAWAPRDEAPPAQIVELTIVEIEDSSGAELDPLMYWDAWGRAVVEPALGPLARCDPSPPPGDAALTFEVVREHAVDPQFVAGAWLEGLSSRHGGQARECVLAALRALTFTEDTTPRFFGVHRPAVPRVRIALTLRFPASP